MVYSTLVTGLTMDTLLLADTVLEQWQLATVASHRLEKRSTREAQHLSLHIKLAHASDSGKLLTTATCVHVASTLFPRGLREKDLHQMGA